jgi:hypothetical protein
MCNKEHIGAEARVASKTIPGKSSSRGFLLRLGAKFANIEALQLLCSESGGGGCSVSKSPAGGFSARTPQPLRSATIHSWEALSVLGCHVFGLDYAFAEPHGLLQR